MSVESIGCRGTDRATLDIGAAILVVDKENDSGARIRSNMKRSGETPFQPRNERKPLLLVWSQPREAVTLARDIASWAGRVSTRSDN
jgi:hypothetical protein